MIAGLRLFLWFCAVRSLLAQQKHFEIFHEWLTVATPKEFPRSRRDAVHSFQAFTVRVNLFDLVAFELFVRFLPWFFF